MSEEVWKEVPGYNSKYLVSSNGNVKNAKTGRLLTQSHCGVDKNYRSVNLSINGVRYSLGVHRLVATAFVDNPGMFTEVHHLDSDPTNNKASNLSWVSRLENVNLKERNHKINIIENDKVLKVFNSMNELSRKLSISVSLLRHVLEPVDNKDFNMTKDDYDKIILYGDKLYKSYNSKTKSLNAKGSHKSKVKTWLDSLDSKQYAKVKKDLGELSVRKFRAKYNNMAKKNVQNAIDSKEQV